MMGDHINLKGKTMSEELRARRDHVEEKIKKLIEPLDSSIKALHNEMLSTDPSENLDELQQIERLEGFHDYLVLTEVAKVEHPNIQDFDEFKLQNPDTLLSFGTGQHREPLESDDVQVDDTVDDVDVPVSDEDESEEATEVDEALEEARATNEGMPMNPDENPEIVSQSPVVQEEDENLESAGWVKSGTSDEAEETEVAEAKDAEVVEENTGKSEEEITEESEERVPGRIDAKAISEKEFERKRGGYPEDDVDHVLDGVIEFFKDEHTAEECEAKILELSTIEFRKPIFAQGLNPSEVDGFISAIIAELKNRASKSEK